MTQFAFLCLIVGFALAFPATTQAIPPPDLIVNIGSQVGQIFALLVVLFTAAAGVIAQYFKIIFAKMKAKKLAVGVVAIAIIIVSLVATYYLEADRVATVQGDFEQEVTESIQTGIEINDALPDPAPQEISSFFEDQQNLPLAIVNAEFAALENSAPYVLDAREDEEYEIGYYPGSVHIRLADILAGSWRQLPTDRVVYVFCWSGIRGNEVASFLRSKGIVARYFEEGSKGWVDAGGTWQGGILFSSKYPEARYTGTFTKEQVDEYVAQGAILLDVSIFFTPTAELPALFAQVPPESTVITVCHDYVSCFDAKIAGVKLEKLGHTFLGRYFTSKEN
jgi:rhodanese-related sulfurtransferase